MEIQELRRVLKDNSQLDEPLCLYDKSDRQLYCVSSDAPCRLEARRGKKRLNLYFTCDPDGAVVTPGDVVEVIDSALCDGCREDWRCQIALVNGNGDARGYLSDPLWSRLTVEAENSFSLDNPVDVSDLDKGAGAKLLDFFTAGHDGPAY